jgi:phospholipid/cholesterol/gamma-HCH transport system substrate-binding protein
MDSSKMKANIKLGLFSLAAIGFLILLLYTVGKNRHLFGATFTLKCHFKNVQGLRTGNNVRYGGIDVGTVKKLIFLNDTLIEATLQLNNELKGIVRKNAIVNIGTDGLVGNKIIYITAKPGLSETASDNDILAARTPVDTDDMLRVLQSTNQNVKAITETIKSSAQKLDQSDAFWQLLQSKTFMQDLEQTAHHVHQAGNQLNQSTAGLRQVIHQIQHGDGLASRLLNDTGIYPLLHHSIQQLEAGAYSFQQTLDNTASLTRQIQSDYSDTAGILYMLLHDSTTTRHLKQTISHLHTGSEEANQILNGLKHSFLLRSYFRKLDKKKSKN